MSQLDMQVVIENSPNPTRPELFNEHGLSIHFTIDNQSWLYDVGASDKWIHNSRLLGIDIENVDHLILSHGHNDHTGGLVSFLQNNSKADIIASNSIPLYNYFSFHHGTRNIGLGHHIYNDNLHRFHFITQSIPLSTNITAIRNSCCIYPRPFGNKYLTVESQGIETAYTANDEIALAITTANGLIVISACSHNGVLNILQSCVNATKCSRILAFVGGMHLIDIDAGNKDDVKYIAHTLHSLYPGIILYTGHCTGKNASKILSEEFQDQFIMLHSGKQLTF